MAIDVRELRIGNHVLYMGERCKVTRLSDMGLIDVNDEIVVEQEVDPIPITEELLTELGFEKDDDNIINVTVFSKDIYRFFIEVRIFNRYDEWRVHIDDCDHDSVGVLDLHYLHELENFIFMATKKELI